MKKNIVVFMSVAVLILLAICSFPCSSPGITVQGGQTGSRSNVPQQNVRVERIVVKEIGDSYVISSDGKTIRFDSGTKVYKNLNQASKMRTAELHYVDGRLVAIYIM